MASAKVIKINNTKDELNHNLDIQKHICESIEYYEDLVDGLINRLANLRGEEHELRDELKYLKDQV